jgi:DNA-directed RNA polymerase subunit RPC12/RpoP
MNEFKCPNCNTVIEIQAKTVAVVCKKCLHDTGKRFIMTETNSTQKYDDMGDGFFQKK